MRSFSSLFLTFSFQLVFHLSTYIGIACHQNTYTCYEVLFMTKSSTILLFISFFFLLFNGTSIGFILFHSKLEAGFAIVLFCSTSLYGALLAAIASKKNPTYYTRLFFYSHLGIILLPFYYYGISLLLS